MGLPWTYGTAMVHGLNRHDVLQGQGDPENLKCCMRRSIGYACWLPQAEATLAQVEGR
jgi:hypothetical protein